MPCHDPCRGLNPPSQGLEEKVPLNAAMAACSVGAGSPAAAVPCCWWMWIAHNLSAFTVTGPKVVLVVFAQHNAQMTGQARQEKEEEERTGLMTRRANHKVHRVATAAFWRTFHHEGKISPGW
jgi:hypothetical protein